MSLHHLLPFAALCTVVAACDAKSGRTDDGKEVRIAYSSDSGLDVTTRASKDGMTSKVVDSTEASREGKPTFAEGPDGSVSMSTRSGALVMSLRHDSVVVAFSDSIRREVQQKVKTSMAEKDSEGSALGQVIEGVVKSSVSGALSEVFDKSRGFPVSSLSDVQYEDGAIQFRYRRKPTWTFDSFKTDHTPLLEQFHPADAARFVGAVRARMRRS